MPDPAGPAFSVAALRELRASDSELLRRFYDRVYTREFPDPNERESFENMVMYLNAVGTHQNGYHIVLALEGDEPVGGSITDYFAASNAGVIEFIVVASEHRRSGLGTFLLTDAERRLIADAGRRGGDLGFIAAEINDPFRPSATPDNVDTSERARWWDRRGYGRLDFPYIQPALSPEQGPVPNLMLGVKSFTPSHALVIPALTVDAFVRDYMVYAMRISDPASSPEYREMARWLRLRSDVWIVPLRLYIGEDPAHPLTVHGLTGPETRGQQ